jgi:hypothetical protein
LSAVRGILHLRYHNQEGALIWYCGQHRLGRFYADARRVETIDTEALPEAE